MGENAENQDAAPQTRSAPQMEEDGDALLGQDEIEKLLAASLENKPDSKGDEPAASKDSESAKESQVSADEIPSPRAAGSAASAEGIAPGDLEYLFNQAERALRSLDSPSEDGLPPGVQPFELEPFGGAPPSSEMATIDVIRDVELNVRIELGRTQLQIEDVLKLRRGAVVPLDKLAGDPVDIFVNERLIARGEILVLNDNFCVRVTELVAERAIA